MSVWLLCGLVLVAYQTDAAGTLGARGRGRRSGRLDHAIENHDRVYLDMKALKADHNRMRRSVDSEDAPELSVRFRADNIHFDLRLRRSGDLFAPGFGGVDFVRADGTVEKIPLDMGAYLSGIVAGYGADHSRVDAIVGENGIQASIAVGDKYYRLEEASKYDVQSNSYNHVVYGSHDVNDPKPGTCGVIDHDTEDHYSKGASHLHDAPHASTMKIKYGPNDNSSFPNDADTDGASSRSRRAVDVSVQNTCIMHLLADKHFLAQNGGDATTTANVLVSHLTDVNNIYRFTNFDGVAASIKLAIGKLTVFDRVENGNQVSSTGEVSPFITTTSAQAYLDSISSISHAGYCLAHGFTHQDFDNGILGLAYVGVICQNPTGNCNEGNGGSCSRNTGITTSLNYDTSSYIRTTLVIAHELGHNFGMSHDDSCSSWCATQDASACSGGSVTSGNGGNYIMWPSAVDGSEDNNDLFSGCSRASAGARILSDATCFIDLSDGGFCGNGVVEEGEECDCQVAEGDRENPAYIAECNQRDPCCQTNCTLKPTSQCSPKKGTCCSETCELTGLLLDNVTSLLQPVESVDSGTAALHECRAETECQKAAYCIADAQFQGACPSMFHPYANSSADSGYTFYKADKTICAANRATCVQGECRGSLCSAFESASHGNVSAVACSISGESNCVIGCSFEGVTGCLNSFEFTSNTDLDAQGYTFPPGFTGTTKVPGTSCESFTGYCTSSGTCEAVSRDTPLDILTNINVESWIWDYWYIVLGLEGGIIFLAFLLRYSQKRRDTSRWVHAQVKQMTEGLSDTIKKKFTKTRHLAANTKKLRSQQKKRERRERALLIAESRQLAKDRTTKAAKREGEAFSRLKCLFPYSPDDIVRKMIRLCPHEEAAVARLLVLGHPMWQMQDYKTLRYAIRRHRKKQLEQKNEVADGGYIESIESATPSNSRTSNGPKHPHRQPQPKPQHHGKSTKNTTFSPAIGITRF